MAEQRVSVLENAIEIHRAQHEVFDYVSDVANEPAWNPKLQRIDRLTEGRLGVGARYRADFGLGGAMTIEYVEFDRPTRWVTVGESSRLIGRLAGQVLPAGDGVRVIFRMELRLKGLLVPLLPFVRRTMQRAQQGHLSAIKAILEDEARPTSQHDQPGAPE